MTRVAAFREPGVLRLEERERSTFGAGDVLLEIEACGICGSDLGTFRHGHYVQPGQVMGHEICARVLDKGSSVDWLEVGDRTVVRPLRACGDCLECEAGEIQRCASTARMSLAYGEPGGFSDVILVKDVESDEICFVPEHVPALDAMWCEPLAVAVHALRVSGCGTGTPLVVIGGGSVGLCLAAAARELTASAVTLVEPQVARRAAATDLGAHAVASLDDVDLADYAIVIDTSGSRVALASVIDSGAVGVDLTLVGLGSDPLPGIPIGGKIRGSFGYHAADFLDARDLITDGRIRLGSLVTRTWPLTEIQEAFETAADSTDIVKAAIVPAPTERL